MRGVHKLILAFPLTALLCTGMARGKDTLPPANVFDSRLRDCAVTQAIALRPDLISVIASIYSYQYDVGVPSFRTAIDFLQLMPKDVGHEAYRLYTQCVARIIEIPVLMISNQTEQTLTCVADANLSGDRQTHDIILPLKCPPEMEQGYDFTISGAYACGNVARHEIRYNERKRPIAVSFDTRDGCFRVDNDSEAAKAECVRVDVPAYKAQRTCFVVSFHVRK